MNCEGCIVNFFPISYFHGIHAHQTIPDGITFKRNFFFFFFLFLKMDNTVSFVNSVQTSYSRKLLLNF